MPVTKEAIFFDRTNLVLGRAAEVGEVLGLNKEKRLIDLVIGETNNYKWKGASYDTYQSSTPWINVLTGNELADVRADEVTADYILVSHGHGDHVGDTVAIAQRTGAMTISNFEMQSWLLAQGVERAHP